MITIGAHTITHCNLARQTEETAGHEIAPGRTADRKRDCNVPSSISPIPMATRVRPAPANSRWRGRPDTEPRVTTRPGMIFPENANHLTALPRVSLNGNYQDARILPVLTSGAATAMWNGFRRVDAA